MELVPAEISVQLRVTIPGIFAGSLNQCSVLVSNSFLFGPSCEWKFEMVSVTKAKRGGKDYLCTLALEQAGMLVAFQAGGVHIPFNAPVF